MKRNDFKLTGNLDKRLFLSIDRIITLMFGMVPQVSVLLCTYNAEKYIFSTLQSIINQSFQDLEILILDNNSNDKTLDIIKDVKDERIKLYPSPYNYGPYKGLNYLLEKSSGNFIAIQDHDDIWHFEKIEKQVNFLKTHSEYIGCGTKTLMWYEGDEKGFEYYLGPCSYYTIHPSLMFRNGNYRYPEKSIYMIDALFQKKILCKNQKKIFNLSETLTLHRIREGAHNYSYKRFSYSKDTFQTIFSLHSWKYGIAILGRETLRKAFYPFFHFIGKNTWIDINERIPFVLLRNKIQVYSHKELKKLGFMIHQ